MNDSKNHSKRKTSMAYDDYGQGFPVLFIHGHPFNRTMWTPQVQSLRWKYRTIVPDLQGYGESAPLPTDAYTQERYAADLAALLDELGVRQACVVGLSMGGQIAMEFARAFPERTAALVLAATFAEPETPQGVVERNRAAERMETEGIVPIGAEMIPRLIGRKAIKENPAIALKIFTMICSTSPSGAAAAVRGRAMRQDYRPGLQSFLKPAMLVLGTDDSYTSIANGEKLQASMPNCRLEIFQDIGHMPNLEAEDRFNRCLHSFLESIERTTPPAT
ncbi:MAG TPA: alpha/beta hydrolase [Granulicella sp.]|jgi:pimeloyl-ACP methyl ester carboxylesterase